MTTQNTQPTAPQNNERATRTRRTNRTRAASAALAAAAIANNAAALAQNETQPSAHDAPLALVIDDQLNTHLARWLGIDERGLVITPAFPDQTHDDLPQSPLVAIMLPTNETTDAPDPKLGVGAHTPNPTPAGERATRYESLIRNPPTGLATLTDGQQIAGAPDTVPSADAQPTGALPWSLAAAGDAPLAIQLERLRSAAFHATPHTLGRLDAAPDDRDLLILANNDQATGFIASLAGPAVIETDAGELSLPLDLIAGVSLANPHNDRTGTTIYLDDRSILTVENAEIDNANKSLRLTAPDINASATRTAEPQDLAIPSAAVLAAAQPGIVPLASLTPQRQQTPQSAVVPLSIQTSRHPDDLAPTGATPLGLADLTLPGPMSVTYNLPQNTTRFATTAHLDPAAARWAHCTLTISLDRQPHSTITFSSEHPPTTPINIPTNNASSLTITLDEGQRGPIGDRVTLRRPILRVNRNNP